MSRRKQSNPKPLKRDDEDWNSDSEQQPVTDATTPGNNNDIKSEASPDEDTGTARPMTPSSVPPQSASESPPPEPTAPATPPNEVVQPPRLRLNTSLATDPALRPQASVITQAPPPADPPEDQPQTIPIPKSVPTPIPLEYLESLPPDIQEAIAAGRLFGFPPLGLVNPAVVPPETKLPTPDTRSETSSNAPNPSRLVAVPLYMCVPCGIKFSSLSTLDAHQTYYCSHRKNGNDSEDVKSHVSGGTDSIEPNDDSSSENPHKVARTGKQYACVHCSYSADKKVSLNRHMRMHSASPIGTAASTVPSAPIQDRYCADCDIRFSSTKTFRAHKMHYCSTRHITAGGKPNVIPSIPNSSQTKNSSSCTSGSAPQSPIDNNICPTPPSPIPQSTQSHFLALPTNPTLIIPYSLLRSASVLTGSSAAGIPSNDAPCLYVNGSFQLVSQAITNTKNTTRNTTAPSEVLKAANKPRDPGAPLDLSVRRTPELNELGDEHEKENLQRSPTPEQIICAPSLPGSPPLTPSPRRSSPSVSSSPKRKHNNESRSNSPRYSRTTPKSNQSDTENSRHSPESAKTINITSNTVPSSNPPGYAYANIHPLLMGLPPMPPELAIRLASELPVTTIPSPQVLVKQGVSKCKECNIVFCKHENYVIHKKHYCSARLQEDESGGTTSKTATSPPTSPIQSVDKVSPTGQYQQLICAACGIKFTSLDNLNAHQAYYCLKRNELPAAIKLAEADVRRCVKCKQIAEPGHQCVLVGPPTGGWKCPCCDVISSTANAAQRHMETHSGVKAYRCTICRYKGNTLRGMRTHIRMHLGKRTADLQGEEKYITCVLDDENLRNNPQVPSSAESDSQSPGGAGGKPSGRTSTEQRYFCDQCNFSSQNRANVLQHQKTAHGGVDSDNKSKVSEDDDSSRMSNGQSKSMPLIDSSGDDVITIKRELPDESMMEVDVISDDHKDLEHNNSDRKPSLPPSECCESAPIDDNIIESPGVGGGGVKSGTNNKYCKSCDIPFNYYSSYVAHKKFYCSSHAGEITQTGNNNNTSNNRTAEASVL
ncbi:zinc finger protein ush isoform X2 [Chrysoperla carnea]|uniref:zinc finger protein ush isoform X2 n=1 Tax=Chrysoperla carnea TaxID=189513 RepID=UPI001D0687EA|nr:zinc finger protein ush isoform X2 [Chrysoperla carnea]